MTAQAYATGSNAQPLGNGFGNSTRPRRVFPPYEPGQTCSSCGLAHSLASCSRTLGSPAYNEKDARLGHGKHPFALNADYYPGAEIDIEWRRNHPIPNSKYGAKTAQQGTDSQ